MPALATETAEADPVRPPDESTFTPTFKLLRKPLRNDIFQLYGALRTLDDLVDDREPEAAERVAAVEQWCRTGSATTPESRAFEDLADRRGLRPAPVADFCLGMRHDISSNTIDTEAELDLYCSRVSGAVAVMIAQIVGASDPVTERRMTALGVGVQLTHILRDIDVDQDDGRTYVPLATIERFGSITPGKREALLRYEIARADKKFEEAEEGIRRLPEGRRWVAAGAGLYRQILRQIEREGYGGKPGRAVVPNWRKQLVIVKAAALGR